MRTGIIYMSLVFKERFFKCQAQRSLVIKEQNRQKEHSSLVIKEQFFSF